MSLQREVELKSDAGMDYSKLRDLLKAGKWKEADEETERVMLAVANLEEESCSNSHFEKNSDKILLFK